MSVLVTGGLGFIGSHVVVELIHNNHNVTVFKKGEWKIIKHKVSSKTYLKETWISGSIYSTMSYGKVFLQVVG